MSTIDHLELEADFPDIYNGQVDLGDRTLSVAEAANYHGHEKIIKRFGRWIITDYGIDCLFTEYPIGKGRFDEMDWVKHLSEKPWVRIDDFKSALAFAKTYHADNT